MQKKSKIILLKKSILITGSNGFIGFHLSKKLLQLGYIIIGLDNCNDYYDISLKNNRLKILNTYDGFTFIKGDIKDYTFLLNIFKINDINYIIHLAGQAGVRYSIQNPKSYIENNINGFWNILDISRKFEIEHFVYASSSSIYGGISKTPYSINQKTDKPLSLYAATKKSNELIAHSYSSIYDIKTSGLRFFTVYGPWGRPDMAYYNFTKSIIENRTIDVFNFGELKRDFTYIDDIVDGILKVLNRDSSDQYKIYNIGNSNPIVLLDFIKILENILNKKADLNFIEHQKGDVFETFADIEPMVKEFDYSPKTSIKNGLVKFVNWYKDYHKIKL